MIVNPLPDGWEIIYQRAHEQLALHLGCFWHSKFLPKRWPEVLAAIGDHDNEQQSWQGKSHLNTAGAPIDFSHKNIELEQIEKVVDDAAYKSRYIAVLIGLHTNYLYADEATKNKQLKELLRTQEKQRQAWLKELGITLEEAQSAYCLLHWCDRCSLILCRRELPEDERKLEVFKGPDGKQYFIWKRKDESLGLSPWPFSEDKLEVYVETRRVTQLKFKSDNELARQLAKAPVTERKWVFKM
jgi:hypothetical protein